MEREYLLMVVDGNYLAHRSYYKGMHLKTSKGVPSGGVYLFLRSLESMFKKYPYRYVVVFDGGHSEYRKHVYQEYKESRDEKDQETRVNLHFTVNTLRVLLPSLGIPVVQVSGYEGDDLIYWISRKHKSIICSDDSDFLQALDVADVYQPMKDEYWTKARFEKEYGFPPSVFSIYKAIIGDPSDNIPGIKGIGPKRAMEILKGFEGSIDDIEDWLKQKDDKYSKQVLENLNLVYRNYKLVSLEHFYEKEGKSLDLEIEFGDRDLERARKILESLEIRSLSRIFFINS